MAWLSAWHRRASHLGVKQRDIAALWRGGAGDPGVRPLTEDAGTAVEDHEGAGVQPETGQILVELRESILQRIALTGAAHLYLDGFSLNGGLWSESV